MYICTLLYEDDLCLQTSATTDLKKWSEDLPVQPAQRSLLARQGAVQLNQVYSFSIDKAKHDAHNCVALKWNWYTVL